MRKRPAEDVTDEIRENMLPSHKLLFFNNDSIAGDIDYFEKVELVHVDDFAWDDSSPIPNYTPYIAVSVPAMIFALLYRFIR